MKNILILIIGILLFFNQLRAQTLLTPDEFKNKLLATTDEQLLDVRTPTEYAEGHLSNANNIDYKSPEFRDKIKLLDKSKPVFVYCLGGVRSASAAAILSENGFKEIYDMKGGYLKWTSSGKLIDRPKGVSEKRGMNAAKFKSLVTSAQIVLVDFYAPWCEPCIKMMPTVNKLSLEYGSRAKIATINYDSNKTLAKELGIDEIPAFLIYKNGKLVERKTGYLEEDEFRKLLDKRL
jgi:thioredoxin 1